MYQSRREPNIASAIAYACCGIIMLTTCIAVIIYGTNNMYDNEYNGMSCGGNNITMMNVTNENNCYTIDFITCVYDHYICDGNYHITYPLNNTCVNNSTMEFIINNVINKTEFTCYINGHHGTIIDNTVVYNLPPKFLIISWCMFGFVLICFLVHCCIENNKRNNKREYYMIA